MKKFLRFVGIFAACAVVVGLLMAVVEIFPSKENLAVAAAVALVLAGLITAIVHLVRRVEQVEYRAQLLEYKVSELEKNKDKTA